MLFKNIYPFVNIFHVLLATQNIYFNPFHVFFFFFLIIFRIFYFQKKNLILPFFIFFFFFFFMICSIYSKFIRQFHLMFSIVMFLELRIVQLQRYLKRKKKFLMRFKRNWLVLSKILLTILQDIWPPELLMQEEIGQNYRIN
jgi:hypothetical protein